MKKYSREKIFSLKLEKKLQEFALLMMLILMLPVTVSASKIEKYTVSFEINNLTLKQALDQIEAKLMLNFFFNEDVVDINKKLNLKLNKANLTEVVQSLFGESFGFRLVDDIVVVRKLIDIKHTKLNKRSNLVKGTVLDEMGEPLAGASVSLKGTSDGTFADANGKFQIDTEELKPVLIVSFIGMITKEFIVNRNEDVQIRLDPLSTALDEVVVIGYGTQLKSKLTGSIVDVTGKEIVKKENTNLSSSLQGVFAGMSVSRTSSNPSESALMRVRGITTLQGSNDPLILVDDVPIESIDDVNPKEIESISILKDGASAAIYGSRAAAGVVLITTKRANKGDLKLIYEGDFSISTATKSPNSVASIRYLEMTNEREWNDNDNDGNKYPRYTKQFIDTYLQNHAQNPDKYPITNWKNLLMNDYATTQKHSFSFSGGTENIMSRLTLNSEEHTALYDYQQWNKYSLRVNNDFIFNDYLEFNLDASYKLNHNKGPQVNPLPTAYMYSSIYAATWQNGNIAEGKSGSNIYAMLHEGGHFKWYSHKLHAKFGINFKPIHNLKLTANLAPNFGYNSYKSFRKQIPYWESTNNNQTGNPISYIENFESTNLYEERTEKLKLTSQFLINYYMTFYNNSIHSLLGYEEFSVTHEQFKIKGEKLESDEFPYMSQAPISGIFDNGSYIVENAYRSLFGRLSYDYNHKYFLQLNFRRDGSAKFGQDYRWGIFPSISVGWLISDEQFMKAYKNQISLLKLRASYGELGNDRLGDYLYTSYMEIDNVLFGQGDDIIAQKAAAQKRLAIENITWETTRSLNFATDISLFNNRLEFSFEYYYKRTFDMLLDLSLPSYAGTYDPRYNVGSMNTQGWDFSISYQDSFDKLSYMLSFNISDSKSVIGDINNKRIFSGGTISEEGVEYRTHWGYLSDGLFQTQEEVDNSPVINDKTKPGDVKYKDISGPNGIPDGVIDTYDETYLGGSLPRFVWGASVDLKYKNFDLTIALNGVGKRNSYLSTWVVMPFQRNWFSPPSIIDGKYWSVNNSIEQNQKAEYPRLSKKSENNNYKKSDFWMIDGSYIRLKNITLGYTIPNDYLKFGVNKFRIFVSGHDLFSIDNFPDGWDPEQGVDSYLITKSFKFGLSINF
jgi:TonB-linked SusC/RagA family outer membrane protein